MTGSARGTGRHHDVPCGPLTLRGLESPELVALVPAQLLHFASQHQSGPEVELVRDTAEVGVQLVLLREHVVPVRVRRERQRVQVALDVHRGTRVGVVAPHAADVAGAVDKHEVVETRLLQPHRGGDRTEAGANDRDVVMRN